MISLLSDFTYGFTNFAGTKRTVCHKAFSLRASHREPGKASIPITVRAARSKNCSSVFHRNVTRWIGAPVPSSSTLWKRVGQACLWYPSSSSRALCHKSKGGSQAELTQRIKEIYQTRVRYG